MPLIASSIMSKKIAGGAQAIVLDVKIGLGAFMETLEEGRELAHLMVAIARLSGRKAVCLLSDMNQPLGNAVGNALEVKEAIDTLHLHGPRDFHEHALEVASQMLHLGGKAASLDEARYLAESALKDGRAWQKFRRLIEVQGGDVRQVDDPKLLPAAKLVEVVAAPQAGWLQGINAREIGEASVDLGAGRARKGDAIDMGVGFVIHRKVGDRVGIGDPLFTIHANSKEKLALAKTRLLAAHTWSDQPCPRLPLFYEVIR